MASEKRISNLLLALTIFDIILVIWAFFFPQFWFSFYHGTEYVDPQALLKRCGANWAAFALLEFLAFRNWKKNSFWLAIIAGVRLSDIFTDITCAFMATNLTVFGWVGFLVMSPTNLLMGLWFLKAYKAR